MSEPTQESVTPRPSNEGFANRTRTLPSFRIALRPTIREITHARRVAETKARDYSLGFVQPPETLLEIVTAQEADVYLRNITDAVHLRDLDDEVRTRSYEIGGLQGKLTRKWRELLQESGSTNRVDVLLPFHGVEFDEEQFSAGKPGTKISLLMGDYRSDEEAAPVLDAVNRTFGGEYGGESRLTAQRLSLPLGFVATDELTARYIFENPLGGQLTHSLPFMPPLVQRANVPQQN